MEMPPGNLTPTPPPEQPEVKQKCMVCDILLAKTFIDLEGKRVHLCQQDANTLMRMACKLDSAAMSNALKFVEEQYNNMPDPPDIKPAFSNPSVAQKLVNLVTSNKPSGWSHKSNAPYFKRIYGAEIKEYIDKMMVDKQSIVYRYFVWCTDETGIAPTTLYNRINQSIRYLIENMDTPDHKYGQWYETVNISRQHDVGVIIAYIPGFGNAGEVQLKAESIAPKSSAPVWMRKMDEWIEDNDNLEPFVKEGLGLSQQEIVNIKVKLAPLKNIQHSITESYVRLIRL